MKPLPYNPVESRYWSARVEHLLTYRAKHTARKFKNNRAKLYQEIAEAVDRAVRYQDRLAKAGRLARDQIAEAAYQVVAPTEAIPPEDRGIPEETYLEIREWAENPPEGR